MADFEHELGATVRCRITGLTGILMSRTEHLFGCKTYTMQPNTIKDGEPAKAQWFDEGKLETIAPPTKELLARRVEATARSPGGPAEELPGREMPEPQR